MSLKIFFSKSVIPHLTENLSFVWISAFVGLTAASFTILSLSGCTSLGVIQERLAPKQMDDGKVLFRYYSPSARTVTLAGDFNGWEHKQDQSRTIYLKKNEKDIWEATVPLQEGRYRYKYVLDYQSWVLDPNNPLSEDDGTGNFNSLIIVR